MVIKMFSKRKIDENRELKQQVENLESKLYNTQQQRTDLESSLREVSQELKKITEEKKAELKICPFLLENLFCGFSTKNAGGWEEQKDFAINVSYCLAENCRAYHKGLCLRLVNVDFETRYYAPVEFEDDD